MYTTETTHLCSKSRILLLNVSPSPEEANIFHFSTFMFWQNTIFFLGLVVFKFADNQEEKSWRCNRRKRRRKDGATSHQSISTSLQPGKKAHECSSLHSIGEQNRFCNTFRQAATGSAALRHSSQKEADSFSMTEVVVHLQDLPAPPLFKAFQPPMETHAHGISQHSQRETLCDRSTYVSMWYASSVASVYYYKLY